MSNEVTDLSSEQIFASLRDDPLLKALAVDYYTKISEVPEEASAHSEDMTKVGINYHERR